MATKTLTVSYKAGETPPVVVSPSTIHIHKNKERTLEWVREAGATWTFSAIEQANGDPLPDPPFSGLQVTDAQMSVTDDNTSAADRGSWSYKVGIVVNGTTIWSDPQIINKGGD
jgi:hypothetical protein